MATARRGPPRDGIRLYEAAAPAPEPLSPEERSRRIVRVLVGILAPLAQAGLAATFRRALDTQLAAMEIFLTQRGVR